MKKVNWEELGAEVVSEETTEALMELEDFVIELHDMTIIEKRIALNFECSREELVYILEGWEIVAGEKSVEELINLILGCLENE